jgi:hypothetical protein
VEKTGKEVAGSAKAQRMEYQRLNPKVTRSGEDDTIRSVAGISMDRINGEARKGWRVVHLQSYGRKIVLVVMERPRQPKAAKPKATGGNFPRKDKKTPPGPF